MGERDSRSTYDGYGIGSVKGEGKVADDGISLHCTMVWLRFFLWLEQIVPVPTQTSRAEGAWFCMQPRKATTVAQRGTPGQCHHTKNSRKFPCPCLGTTVRLSSPVGCGCDGDKNYPLALPNNNFPCTNSHVVASKILHYFL